MAIFMADFVVVVVVVDVVVVVVGGGGVLFLFVYFFIFFSWYDRFSCANIYCKYPCICSLICF